MPNDGIHFLLGLHSNSRTYVNEEKAELRTAYDRLFPLPELGTPPLHRIHECIQDESIYIDKTKI
jgi:hypothetical protein